MSGVPDVAVHVVRAADAERLEEPGDRRGGGNGFRDGRLREGPRSEHDASRPVEVHRGDEKPARALREVVGQSPHGKGAADEFLELPHREEPGRHVGTAPREDVRPVEPEVRRQVLSDRPHQAQKAAAGVGNGAPLIHRAAVEVQRVVTALVEDRVEIGGPDLIRHQRCHHRARARAHVEVEVVGAKAGQRRVEGGERAHLVHAADHAAAREHERPAGASRTPRHPGQPLAQHRASLSRVGRRRRLSARPRRAVLRAEPAPAGPADRPVPPARIVRLSPAPTSRSAQQMAKAAP